MDIEPRPDSPLTDADRQAAAQQLERAAGELRIDLSEFSGRVGAVWAANTRDELAVATEGLAVAPAVGTTKTVSRVVAIMSDTTKAGRWRLPERMTTWCLMGGVHLDLRAVVSTADVVEIRARSMMGDVEVLVPDGVEVELTGFSLMGDHELTLAPVPRVAGTPLIRIRAVSLMGDVSVRSAAIPKKSVWRRMLRMRHPEQVHRVPPPVVADPPPLSVKPPYPPVTPPPPVPPSGPAEKPPAL